MRSRSDTWISPPAGIPHNADTRFSKSTHCWQCGAALLSQSDPFPEKTSSLSPTSRLPLLSQPDPVDVQAPPLSANHHLDTPGKSNSTSSLTQTDKLMRMKDAMLDATDIPVFAMWHDESIAVPNKAVARLMHFDTDPFSDDAGEILSRYRCFTEDFERELEQHEFPIVRLTRTRQPFSRLRVGLMDSQLRQGVFEVVGQCVYDEKTGAFQAAVIALKDVTWYTDLLKVQSERNEQGERQFQLICETLPQMVRNMIRILPRLSEKILISDNSYGLLPQKDV